MIHTIASMFSSWWFFSAMVLAFVFDFIQGFVRGYKRAREGACAHEITSELLEHNGPMLSTLRSFPLPMALMSFFLCMAR